MNQNGTSLIEVLVGVVMLSLGLTAAARLHATLAEQAEAARQHTEATFLAQQAMEQLRTPEHGDIAPTTITLGAQTYNVTPQVDQTHTLQPLGVSVTWVDRRAQAQQVRLSSYHFALPPLYSAWLAQALPAQSPIGMPFP